MERRDSTESIEHLYWKACECAWVCINDAGVYWKLLNYVIVNYITDKIHLRKINSCEEWIRFFTFFPWINKLLSI